LSLQSWEILSSRQLDQLSEDERLDFDQNAVYLCALKKAYKARNIRKICDLRNPRVIVQAVNQPPGGTRFDANKAGGLPNQLMLTRGMRVMLTANVDLSNGLSNGSTGTVVGIIYFSDQDTIPTVIVQFDGYTGQSCLTSHARAYPVSRIERTWSQGKTRYTRLMLPLLPAYGFSIHKAQGQTLDKVVINLGVKDFAAGLTYTALTRARGLRCMAFHPMPTLDRLNSVIKSKSFKEQKADGTKKALMDEELRLRQQN
jgi:ATP-dependent DNA helicase PIF1